MWEILRRAGIDPAPERTAATWASFLRSQADALLACDFFETVTLTGARLHVLAVIEHATRRIRVLGATHHPTCGCRKLASPGQMLCRSRSAWFRVPALGGQLLVRPEVR